MLFPELSHRLNVYGASVAMLRLCIFMSSRVLPILLLCSILLSHVLLSLLKSPTSSMLLSLCVQVHYLHDVVGFHFLVLCSICPQLRLFFLLLSFHSILTLNFHLLSCLWIHFWQFWDECYYSKTTIFTSVYILCTSLSSDAWIYQMFFLLCNLFLGGKPLHSCFPFYNPIVFQLMCLRSLCLVVRTWWWLMSLLFAVNTVW